MHWILPTASQWQLRSSPSPHALHGHARLVPPCRCPRSPEFPSYQPRHTVTRARRIRPRAHSCASSKTHEPTPEYSIAPVAASRRATPEAPPVIARRLPCDGGCRRQRRDRFHRRPPIERGKVGGTTRDVVFIAGNRPRGRRAVDGTRQVRARELTARHPRGESRDRADTEGATSWPACSWPAAWSALVLGSLGAANGA
jgi:hypothetical protein